MYPYSLESAAAEKFGPLRPAERRLLAAALTGNIAWGDDDHRDLDAPENDPEQAGQWGEEREVRAILLRWLCEDPDARASVVPEGIQMGGAKFDDRLALSCLTLPFPLRLSACHFPKGLQIESAVLPELTLERSWIGPFGQDTLEMPAIAGRFLKVTRFVDLNRVRAVGELQFSRAEIGGHLLCKAALFKNAGGISLNCEAIDIKGSALLRDRFKAVGTVRFFGAKIGGAMDCQSASLVGPDLALTCEMADIRRSVLLRGGFTAEGEVSLFAAKIGGALECDGATLKNPKGAALSCEGAIIERAALLRRGFRAEGEVRLFCTEIGGALDCEGATLENPEGTALTCESAAIGRAVLLRHGFSAEGQVSLFGARIGGALDCEAATLKNPKKIALHCEAAVIGRAALLRRGFAVEGEVRLFGARIAGNLSFQGASLKAPASRALSCDGAEIGGAVLLTRSCAIEGDVLLAGARLNHLEVEGCDLSSGAGGSLSARLAQVKGSMQILNVRYGPGTKIDLRETVCDVFVDDAAALPAPGNLFLDGFSYRRLANPGTAKQRLDWLRRQLPAEKRGRHGQFRPQPYRMLAQTLRVQGHESDARAVLIGMAEDRRRYAQMDPSVRFWQWVSWHVMRNGYRPMRAILWLVLLWSLNFAIFAGGYGLGMIGPSQKDAYDAFSTHSTAVPPWYPKFHPLVYSVDVSLPIISLGERDKWQPLDQPVMGAAGWPGWLKFVGTERVSLSLAIWRWTAIALGWFFASMLVAGVSGLVARD